MIVWVGSVVQTWVRSLRLQSWSFDWIMKLKPKPKLCLFKSWSRSRIWSPGVWWLLKRPLFHLIHLIFTKIQANCSGQDGLKVKTVDIFSFWDHKGKNEDLASLDHEDEAVQSQSFCEVTKLKPKLWLFEITKLKPKLWPQKLRLHEDEAASYPCCDFSCLYFSVEGENVVTCTIF